MKEILENTLIEEAKWDPQLVLPLRSRTPDDPLLHWVAIWFAARNLLSDADEHPEHWDTKYEGYMEDEVLKIRDEAECEWRALWSERESSPNLAEVRAVIKRFVGYKSFPNPPEGL